MCEHKNDLWGERPDEEAFFKQLFKLPQAPVKATDTEIILAFCSTEEMNNRPTYHLSLSLSHAHTHTRAHTDTHTVRHASS